MPATTSDADDANLDAASDDFAFVRARADLYGLLATVFDGETDVLAEAVDAGAFAELAAVLPGDFDASVLAGDPPDREALAVGYDNLFVVPGPYYVPPFASAHADDPSEAFESDSPYHDEGSAGELLGDPAERLAALHEQFGFAPKRGDGIPDHVAAVFEFLAALAAEEASRLADEGDAADVQELRETQRTVVADLAWLDDLDAAVNDVDSVEGTFGALTSLARSVVAWDAREGVGTTD